MQGKPSQVDQKEMIGSNFGYLTVEKAIGKRQSKWLCKCYCGVKREFYSSDLLGRHNTSCGCMDGKAMFIHGLWQSRIYRIWDGIQKRCKNPKSAHFERYGGRGIKCLWPDFNAFQMDMYPSYLEHSEKHGIKDTTIDRIDNDGHYSKENCRWATLNQQNRNKIDNVFVEYKGKNYIVTDYASLRGLKKATIYGRLRRGWSNERVISEPVHTEFGRNKPV